MAFTLTKIDGDIFYADEHMAALGFGTGADGAYSNGGDLNQNNIYNFTSFSLTNTITTTSTSGKPIYILVQGNCTISGTINLTGLGYDAGAGGADGAPGVIGQARQRTGYSSGAGEAGSAGANGGGGGAS